MISIEYAIATAWTEGTILMGFLWMSISINSEAANTFGLHMKRLPFDLFEIIKCKAVIYDSFIFCLLLHSVSKYHIHVDFK